MNSNSLTVCAATLLLVLCCLRQPVRADDAPEASKAPETSMNERVLSVFGDPDHPATLQVTVFTPSGPGPFPLAIMNHGSNKDERPEFQPRYRHTFSAYYFLSRGYAVALPMMRGYAGSGGKLTTHGCDLAAIGLDAAKDIRAVIDYMVRQPGIDGSRIIVAGQSFGGWNTLALGTLNVPNVKGLVSFAGGVNASDCNMPASSLSQAAERLGARTHIPSIWFWGDNDQVFPSSTWHAMYQSYRYAGAPAELVAYGNFMTDSHNLLGFPEGLQIWGPKLDAFLAKVGLPNKIVYPQYVPMPVPAPTHYAAIDDVDSVPFLNDQGRALYQRFLTKSLPRAIAIAPNGYAASETGGFDPLTKALELCGKAAPNCRLYAVDNDVVWVRPTPAPPPTKFAALADPSVVPYMNDRGRDGYRQFLTYRKPRAFAISPDGGWFASARGVDPLAMALENCGKTHQGCRLYAVDSDVVWSGK